MRRQGSVLAWPYVHLALSSQGVAVLPLTFFWVYPEGIVVSLIYLPICVIESSPLKISRFSPQQEKPPQWEAHTPRRRVAPARHN